MKFTLEIDLDDVTATATNVTATNMTNVTATNVTKPQPVQGIAGCLRRVINLFQDRRYQEWLTTVASSQDEGKIRNLDGRVVGSWRIA